MLQEHEEMIAIKSGQRTGALISTLVVEMNPCFICGKEFGQKRYDKPYVDRNQKTGKIRGLLCHRCNYILGLSNDDADLLERAVENLRSSGD